jgi:hypothetical protein
MAGYSGTPLVKKLGIKDGSRVAILGAPDGFAETLGSLPPGTTVQTDREGEPCQVVVFFTTEREELARSLADLRTRIVPEGGLWIAWPKRTSGVATDLTEDAVRNLALAHRLVDNKVCAIDEVWSGLRLVIRLSDRPKKRCS